MAERLVAVPSEEPGGLEARRSSHFGRAPMFTYVRIEGDTIGEVESDANLPHEMGGGHRMISRSFAQHGVSDAIASGIGAPMVAGLRGTGIRIWFDDQSPTVRDAVEALMGERLRPVEEGDVHQHHSTGDDHVA